jgi:alpha-L-fucosidase
VWGVYSVPSWSPPGTYAEWYWWNLEQNIKAGSGPFLDFHYRVYGKNFKYANFASLFKAELFNVTEWGDILAASGAQYVVPSAKFHDGYCLWDSPTSWMWNSVDIGPEMDLLKMIFDEIKRRGIHTALYFSLFEWFNPIYRGPNPHQYVEQQMLPQLYDLINNYQPDYIFADGEWEQNSTFWNSTNFLAWLYNDSPVKDSVVVNDRWGNDCDGTNGGVYTAEYDSQIWWNHKWEENSGLDIFSFGYNRATRVEQYFTAYQSLQLLIRSVAYGGNFLLDIGPTADGRIPLLMSERLLEIGAWLKVNGEGIFKTKPWTIRSENSSTAGPIYYTQSKIDPNIIYATFLNWPKDNVVTLAIPNPSAKTIVTFLGYGVVAHSWDNKNGMSINIPFFSPRESPSTYAWTLKITNLDNNFPDLAPIQDYWSNPWMDNAPCTKQSCIDLYNSKNQGYSPIRFEGLLFTKMPPSNGDTLDLYFSSANHDFTAANNISQLKPGYVFVMNLGYVSKVQTLGLVPIDLYWSQFRSDFYLVGADMSYDDVNTHGYVYVTRLGYVYPAAFYYKVFIK